MTVIPVAADICGGSGTPFAGEFAGTRPLILPLPAEASEEQVRQVCGNCHAYPPPESMPRFAWRKEVRQGYDLVRDSMASRGIDMIFLLSPTTTDARVAQAAKLGRGFLYGISRLGVTGTRDNVADGAEPLARRIRAATAMPLALGFGISSPEHVRQIGKWADAAVVGSGLVNVIAQAGKAPDLVERVQSYVRWLKNEPIYDDRRTATADRPAR